MEKENLFEKFIETEAGKIAYYRSGNFSEAPTVLFLHGLSANHTTWLDAAAALRGLSVNSIMPDLRGHGCSDKRRKKSLYCFEIFSRDLKLIMDREKISKALIVGYSFGGALAMDFCLRYPDMCSAAILISANHASPLIYWRLSVLAPIIRAFVYILSYLLVWQKRKTYDYYRPDAGHGYWVSVWRGFLTMPISVNLWLLLMMGRLDLRGRLGAIKIPALLVHSPHDPFVTRREMEEILKFMPNAKEVISENKNHFLATEGGEEVTKIVAQFALSQKKNL